MWYARLVAPCFINVWGICMWTQCSSEKKHVLWFKLKETMSWSHHLVASEMKTGRRQEYNMLCLLACPLYYAFKLYLDKDWLSISLCLLLPNRAVPFKSQLTCRSHAYFQWELFMCLWLNMCIKLCWSRILTAAFILSSTAAFGSFLVSIMKSCCFRGKHSVNVFFLLNECMCIYLFA